MFLPINVFGGGEHLSIVFLNVHGWRMNDENECSDLILFKSLSKPGTSLLQNTNEAFLLTHCSVSIFFHLFLSLSSRPVVDVSHYGEQGPHHGTIHWLGDALLPVLCLGLFLELFVGGERSPGLEIPQAFILKPDRSANEMNSWVICRYDCLFITLFHSWRENCSYLQRVSIWGSSSFSPRLRCLMGMMADTLAIFKRLSGSEAVGLSQSCLGCTETHAWNWKDWKRKV